MILLYIHDFFSSLCGDASLLELSTLSSDATLSSTALVWADDSPCCRGMSGRQMTFLVGKIFCLKLNLASFWPTQP